VLDRDATVLADVPAASLHDAAPSYDRPRRPPDRGSAIEPLTAPGDLAADILGALMETTWVSRQYDHQLFLNTVVGPGGDGTVLRLKHPRTGEDTGRALALTTDGNHRWCAVDPREGTARVVAEAVLNLACVGARPVAVVNCLNFGNPEHAEVMWQLSEAVDGMASACTAFGVPVVGGNVSLYNESAGRDIDPTPIVGVLGVVDRLARRPPGPALVDGATVLLLGPAGDPRAGLVGSRWAWNGGARGGSLEPLDVGAHLAVSDLVRDLVNEGTLAGVHDVADGGLAVTLFEMAVASATGVVVDGLADDPDGWRALVTESPSRVVVAVVGDRAEEVVREAGARGVPCLRLGHAGGGRVTIGRWLDVALDDAIVAWRDRLPRAFGVAVEH
jgi:phosphoribosylformylglycinamidine synthase